jgi:hypothetical protein
MCRSIEDVDKHHVDGSHGGSSTKKELGGHQGTDIGLVAWR